MSNSSGVGKSMVKQAGRPKRRIARLLREVATAERGYVDLVVSSTYTTAGTFGAISGVDQGVSRVERRGNRIVIDQIDLNLSAYINPAQAESLVRFALVIDKHYDGTTPLGLSDVFGGSPSLATSLPVVTETVQKRLNMLLWHDFVLTTGGNDRLNLRRSFRVNSTALFIGTSSTDITSGHVWMFAVSNHSSNSPHLEGQIRVWYHDL
jgi:hypothetical protein